MGEERLQGPFAEGLGDLGLDAELEEEGGVGAGADDPPERGAPLHGRDAQGDQQREEQAAETAMDQGELAFGAGEDEGEAVDRGGGGVGEGDGRGAREGGETQGESRGGGPWGTPFAGVFAQGPEAEGRPGRDAGRVGAGHGGRGCAAEREDDGAGEGGDVAEAEGA